MLQLLVSWAQESPQSRALYRQVAAPELPIEIMSLLGFLPPAPLSTQGRQGSAEAANFIRCQWQSQSQCKTFKNVYKMLLYQSINRQLLQPSTEGLFFDTALLCDLW